MSRFDLFFVILDECNEVTDFNIARHIIGVHMDQVPFPSARFANPLKNAWDWAGLRSGLECPGLRIPPFTFKTRGIQGGAPALHPVLAHPPKSPEIKHKKPKSQCNLYQSCGLLCLISGSRTSRCACVGRRERAYDSSVKKCLTQPAYAATRSPVLTYARLYYQVRALDQAEDEQRGERTSGRALPRAPRERRAGGRARSVPHHGEAAGVDDPPERGPGAAALRRRGQDQVRRRGQEASQAGERLRSCAVRV
eukprot:1184026-Rhodomonas_salina.2